MTTIIGLCGPAGAGKSTIAKYIAARLPDVKRYSFAAPLKEIARKTLDFTEAQVYGTQEQKEAIDPRYGFSPRWFLQRLGTEGVRSVLGDGFWHMWTLEQILFDGPEYAVIDDVRFMNEARAIRAFGDTPRHRGKVWKIFPPTREAEPTHASELEWYNAPADITLKPSYGSLADATEQGLFLSGLL